MKKYFMLICLLFSTSVYAKIEAYFSPNSISQGDSVELVLSSTEPINNVPNIDILQNDFLIGGQQQRQSSQWINGKGSTQYQLSYTLFPNKSGTITIKNLKVGSENVPPVTLTVTANQQYASHGELSLSVECPQTALYPSQTLLCNLFLDDSMGIVDGHIVPPRVADNAWTQVLPPLPIASQLGKGKRYQSVFAFTPKQSGRINIDPFTFQGQVPIKTKKASQYDSIIDFMMLGLRSTATKPVQVQSKPFVLNVKEKPANYQGWWLPSTKVTLTEQYDMPTPIHIGEPISRTLTLKAQNTTADNLPIPQASTTAGLKVYTNPEKRQDSQEGAEIITTLTFVPTQSGEIELPSITVPWFNTTTETIEQASVPRRTILVLAESVAATDTSEQKMIPPTTPSAPASEEKISQPPTKPTEPTSAFVPSELWIYLTLAILAAFLSGLGLAILLIKHKQNKTEEAKKKKPLPDLYPF